MSSSMACKTAADLCVSEPVSVIVSQSSELNLIEMTEVEYIQQIIQSHIETQVSETDSSGLPHPEGNLSENSSLTPSTCQSDVPSDGQCIIPQFSNPGSVDVHEIKMLLVDEVSSVFGCERTPAGGAEVPGSVLEKVQCVIDQKADLFHQRGARPLEGRPSPPARVRLEKRFMSMLCHSTETPVCTHAQTEKWSISDKMGGQQSEVVIPKELTFSFRADKGADSVTRAPCVIYTDTTDLQTTTTMKNDVVGKAVLPVKRARTRALRSCNVTEGSENWKPRAGMSGAKRGRRMRPPQEQTQRREIHNRKERDRRRRIRLCCDELNLLVPFCYADTDKATTLQWTTAFLKYIREIHGDSLKQDFQGTFCGKTGLRLKPSCVSVVHHPELSKDATQSYNSSSHN
ncbi:uncharacterized protein LOC127419217 [Myxocyprinus asiaticus]|uniref:uncharacterized protein LOC127419217 n=1 Tax=Myxocyprinus asiaticus TaxID=70543 RepID=UPI00222277CD|nr:uncharacterized protein LOC127419217 [Myxocyprinus asiaticus]